MVVHSPRSFSSALYEQVLNDGIWSRPSLAARLVWIPLCLTPLDVGVHQAEEGGNVTSTGATVGSSQALLLSFFGTGVWTLQRGRKSPASHSIGAA